MHMAAEHAAVTLVLLALQRALLQHRVQQQAALPEVDLERVQAGLVRATGAAGV
jgi:hypothetical protein